MLSICVFRNSICCEGSHIFTISYGAMGAPRDSIYIFSYVLKVLELRDLYIVRASVRPGSCPEASITVIIARLSNISENDPRKTQDLSAGIVKTSLLTTFVLRSVINPTLSTT